MAPTLTPKQKAVLDFITSFTSEKGYSPSQHEIARHFRFKSLGTVQNYLVRLERQGVLKKTLHARRSVETLSSERSDAFLELPVLGKVAAGKPLQALASEETLEIPRSLLAGPKGTGASPQQHFVLKVSGNSMIEDGILEGDFVIVRSQKTAQNGQTVVALVANEATIKRFYRHKDQSIELRPANPAFEPILIPSLTDSDSRVPDFRIEGVMVGLIRKTA
jgi:repressor LexA